MMRKIFGKAVRVGRATVLALGVAVILALVFGVATTALGANGGNFILGKAGNAATKVTGLVSNVAGATQSALLVRNSGPGSALDLRVGSQTAAPSSKSTPPMKVDSAARVDNLNADKLDGLEASELSDPRGYAHVTLAGAIDTAYSSKGVSSIVTPGNTNLYCFDLTFNDPHAAVGSPFFFNSAVVATVTPPNGALTNACPETHRDAAVKTFASDDGSAAPINFQVVFI